MDKYQIVYTFINYVGEEKEDIFDNDGKGYSHSEAQAVKRDLLRAQCTIVVQAEVIPM